MLIGQPLIVNDEGTAYYSPWFPRGGNAATFVVDVIATWGGTTINVVVETKNSEQDDANAFSPPGSWQSGAVGVSGVGQHSFSAGALLSAGSGDGFKELVRFRYELAGSPGNGVHFRMLAPSWLSNGA